MSEHFSYEISYGKMRVPLYRAYAEPLQNIQPIPESSFTGRANTLFALLVDMEVLGDNFLAAYTQGDNTQVIATDSMKNFILRHARDFTGATFEEFLHSLGLAFLSRYPVATGLRLRARELPFEAVTIPQGESFGEREVLFKRVHGDYAWVELGLQREGEQVVTREHRCGRLDLQLWKLTGSAFTRFVRDDYTTLPERGDRPLFIYLDLYWSYDDLADLLNPSHARYVPAEQVADLVQTVFHEFVSESIQHLVHEMGTRLLRRFPQLAEVTLVAQNRTRDPAVSDDHVKVYTDPFPAYGEIRLTLRRNT